MCDCFPSKKKKNLSLIDWHSLCGGVDSIRDCWRYTTTSCDGPCESFQICTRRRASAGPRCGRAAGRLRGVCFRVFNIIMFISVRPLIPSLSKSSIAWREHDSASKNGTPRLTVGRSLQSPHIRPRCSVLASFASLGTISINISALPLISCACEAPQYI